jgi:hypothetical protein
MAGLVPAIRAETFLITLIALNDGAAWMAGPAMTADGLQKP